MQLEHTSHLNVCAFLSYDPYLYTSKREPSSRRRQWPRRLSILGRRISIGRLESREKSLFAVTVHILFMYFLLRTHEKRTQNVTIHAQFITVRTSLLRAHDHKVGISFGIVYIYVLT
jgi:hypothetical protein